MRQSRAKKKAPAQAETLFLVNLTTTQAETFFENIEEIDPQLKALGVMEVEGTMTYDCHWH